MGLSRKATSSVMDFPQEWPEPVVPVQSLSESGTAVIPDRYIKPPSQRPSLSSDTGCGENIPLVDLGMMEEGVEECEEVMQRISKACREWGFFQVVNHGVSPELLREAREAWRGFFHLPIEMKKAHANSPKTYEGYGSRLGVEKGAILDWGDYYFLHLLPKSLKNRNKWPALPSNCRYTCLHPICFPFVTKDLIKMGERESRGKKNHYRERTEVGKKGLTCSQIRQKSL